MRVAAWITFLFLLSVFVRVVLYFLYATYSNQSLGLTDVAIASFGIFAAGAAHLTFKTLIVPRRSRP